MINHHPRGVAMDLLNSGVYDEDFELVWGSKRDEDGSHSPDIPSTSENSEPKTQSINLWDSTTTTSRISTITSMTTTTTSATATQIFQATTEYDTYIDSFTSTFTTSTSTYCTSTTYTFSTSTIYASTSSPTSTSKSSPKTTITSTLTSSINGTSLNQINPTISSSPDTQGTVMEHQHTSSALAVTISVTVIVSLIALAILAFLVRRALGRQRRRNEVLRAMGEKPVTGMGAIVNGMGIRRHGNGNGGNEGDPEARRPEMKRNPSLSKSETGGEKASDRPETRTARTPSISTISSGWGDGLSIHSLELNETQPVQGLGIRPQTRSPPMGDESNHDISSYEEEISHRRNPFADPQSPSHAPNFAPILLPNFELGRYRSEIGAISPGDMTREYIKNTNAQERKAAPPSLASEIDTLERQREMEGGNIGGEIAQPTGSRWSNPFTAREKRGTRAYEEMGREERSEWKWRDAKSWVRGQVERVKN